MIFISPMHMITDQELLEAVEEFLSRTGMPHTRFGREALRDGALVQHLRAGRSLTLGSAYKVVSFMRNWTPEPKDTAA